MPQEKIGRYEIISELGRGGMASVFRAKDPNFDREVAVKILPRTFLHDPQFRARFEREAKTVAALEHTAIVPVYDFGEEEEQPFIVMRLMAGGSLADKIKAQKYSIEDAAKIIIRLAPGLVAAHDKGIIHRDLKPGNILFDQYNNAYLSDFGIARLAEGDGTLTGSRILGTPAYMSPEQIQGDKNIDGRSDLYAMGVIFYQMIMGDTPFQATTPAKVMMMHIMEPVPNLLAGLPPMPPGVEAWLYRILAKDPDDRFANAQEMADALEAGLRGEVPSDAAALKTMIATDFPGDTTQQSLQSPLRQRAYPTPAPQTAPPIHQQTPPPASYGTQIPPELYTAPPQPVKKRRNLLPITIGIIAILGIIGVGIAILSFFGLQGSGPLAGLLGPTPPTMIVASEAALQTNTPEPSEPTATTAPIEAVPEEPTATIEVAAATPTLNLPTSTPEPTLTSTPSKLAIGGADMIAFLKGNNIWTMNIDGSDLQQLTTDGAEKSDLNWTPDGQWLTYISGKCVWYIDYLTTRADFIACFESATYLDNFTVSPDGQNAAISVNRELYIVPFDLEKLQQVRSNSNLKALSECESMGPMLTTNETAVPAKFFRWAADSSRFSIIKLANDGGQLVDLIQIFDLESCSYEPIRKDEIPAARFEIENYSKTPYLQNFGYDGNYLYAMVSYARNDGYGHLYIYNADLHRADLKVNPIGGNCCYRDPNFSPDGRYLSFVYQPFEAGATSQIYYIPYATIGTGASYEPLPLPDGFLSDPREKTGPVLRPAQ